MKPTGTDMVAAKIASIAEVYGRSLTPGALQVYMTTFKSGCDSPDMVIAAIDEAVATHQYGNMPTPGQIMAIVRRWQMEEGEVKARLVLDAIRAHGHGKSIVFDCPHVMAVIRQRHGSWENLCDTLLEKDTPAFVKKFAEDWCEFVKAGRKDSGTLVGYTDRINSANGYALMEPVKMGDAARCRLVLEGKVDHPLLAAGAGVAGKSKMLTEGQDK